jgi:hypothetical protein
MQLPAILQIFREPLKPGTRAAYDAIERATARIAATHGCPHPYLGIEALTGAEEVWYFNAYESHADRQRVWDAYAANEALMTALKESGARKAPLTLPPIDVFARYREELSQGPAWAPGVGRLLVIAMTEAGTHVSPPFKGTVFETDDGRRFTIRAAAARDEADRIAGAAGAAADVFAVRPDWSFPSREWVDADPEFWT